MAGLIPSPADALGRSLASVYDRLPVGLRDEVAVLYVDDGSDLWLRHALNAAIRDRRRSVLAAASLHAVATALRLGIGGAVLQPVSTPALTQACEAAAAPERRSVSDTVDDRALDTLVATAATLTAVGWFPHHFWMPLIGRRSAVDELHRLATELDWRCVVAGPPMLLGADRDPERARRDIESLPVGSLPVARSLDLTSCLRDGEPLAAIAAAVAATAAEPSAAGEKARAVLDLPTGRCVGHWSPDAASRGTGGGWWATPMAIAGDGHRWRLTGIERREIEVVDALIDEAASDGPSPLLRVPGWVGSEIGCGRPAGLLIERMASTPTRLNRPLWVSNVDEAGVRWLLSLPGPIWVDGPGVPA